MSECDTNDEIIQAIKNMTPDMISKLLNAFNNSGIIKPALEATHKNVGMEQASSEDKKKVDMYNWDSFHSKNIKEIANIPVAVRSALISRFNTFNDSQNQDNMCGQNTDNAINNALAKDETEIVKLKKYNETFLNSYRILETNFKSLRSIINSKLKELNKFSNKIDTYKQNLYIDGRKDSYENSNYDFYKSIYFYIVLFYYILIISYFIFTPFFQDKKYKNIKLVSLIVLYIFIPFMLPYLLSLIYNVYEYILESNNLRGEIISYPYIIEDKQKYE